MSRILFVCSKNVARSQIAEALFPDPVHDVRSAGINAVINNGRTLTEVRAFRLLDCMAKIGHYLDNRRIKQLTPDMVKRADKVIVLGVDLALCPHYLWLKNKPEYWPIPDPEGAPLCRYEEIRDMIRDRIEDDETGLVKRLAVK